MKSPRFFCDNCGAEVGHNVRSCPRCGRFFASVRCPACGFSGEDKLFSGGCPVCGYSAPQGRRKRQKLQNLKRSTLSAAASLPGWVYILSLLAFVFVLAVLCIYIMR